MGAVAGVSEGSWMNYTYSLIEDFFIIIVEKKLASSIVEWMSELSIIVLNNLGEDFIH